MTRTTTALTAAAALAVLAVGAGVARSKKDAKPGALAGHVSLKDADGNALRARGGLVVAVRGVVPPRRRDTLETYAMEQKDKQFAPQVLVVPKGATVSFPNRDKIFHNVFSLSPTARFDLGLYKEGTAKSVEMKRAGEVDVYCNIHPEMVAKILVLDTSYYAVTAPDGSYTIDGLPPGTYPVEVWQPHGDPVTADVTITDGATTTLDPALAQTRTSLTHTRKDGTPYGRYK